MTTSQSEALPLDVAVVAVANIDLVTHVPALPGDGETAFGTQLEARAGGKGLNQAVAVTKHGGRAALVAKAGDDPWGRKLSDTLTSNAVDASAFILVPGGATAAVLVQVPASGDSAVTVTRTETTLHTIDDIRRSQPLLRCAAVTIVQLELDAEVIEAVLTASTGVKIGMLAPLSPLPPAVLSALDIIVVNANEARQILRDVASDTADGRELAQNLVRFGLGAAVVTLGAAGATYADKESSDLVPAPVVDVVDTTGAGDAFLGALALALARGGSLADGVKAGIMAGTQVVTRSIQDRS